MEGATLHFGQGQKSQRTLDNEQFAKSITAGEVRYYLKNIKRHEVNYQGSMASSITPEKVNILNGKSLGDVLYIMAIANQSSSVVKVTPFNVCETLKNKGFHVEYVHHLDASVDFGDTIMSPKNAPAFPITGCAYVKFHNEMSTFYCPIRSSFIDTNYFKWTGIQKMIFNVQIAEICAMFATFFVMKNGVVKFFCSVEAGEKLLSFNSILADGYDVNAAWTANLLGEILHELPAPDIRGWAHTNLSGMNFSGMLYQGLAEYFAGQKGKSGEAIMEILTACNGMVRGTINAEKGLLNYMSINDGSIQIVKPSVMIPQVMCDKVMDITSKSATHEQAAYALKCARGHLGKDKSQKSDLARVGYAGATIDPSLAETVYLLSNLGRFITKFEDVIVVTSDRKAIGTVLKTFEVLQMLEFKGKVFVQDAPNIRSALMPTGTANTWIYAESLFEIITCLTVSDLVSRDNVSYAFLKTVPSSNSLIIDYRESFYDDYTRGTYIKYDANVAAAFEGFYRQWISWSYPVVGRTRLFSDMVARKWDNVQFVSGIELHNMVMWCCVKFELQDDSWWYVVDNKKTFAEVCCASIVCNITRTMRYVYGLSPMTVLNRLKYRVPVVKLSGLAKRGVMTTIWQDTKIQDAMSQGPEKLHEIFAQATGDVQALMMSTPNVRQMLSEGTSSSPISISRPSTPFMLNLKADDEDEDFSG